MESSAVTYVAGIHTVAEAVPKMSTSITSVTRFCMGDALQ